MKQNFMQHPKWVKAQQTLRPQIWHDQGIWYVAIPGDPLPPQPCSTRQTATNIARRFSNRLVQERRGALEQRQTYLATL